MQWIITYCTVYCWKRKKTCVNVIMPPRGGSTADKEILNEVADTRLAVPAGGKMLLVSRCKSYNKQVTV